MCVWKGSQFCWWLLKKLDWMAGVQKEITVLHGVTNYFGCCRLQGEKMKSFTDKYLDRCIIAHGFLYIRTATLFPSFRQ